MILNLKLEIEDRDVIAYSKDKGITFDAARKEIINCAYLGLSCIDGMMNRLFEIDGIESYVENDKKEEV